MTDRVKAGELKVDYCPTDQMIADFFTKPLQGSKFQKFHDLIVKEGVVISRIQPRGSAVAGKGLITLIARSMASTSRRSQSAISNNIR